MGKITSQELHICAAVLLDAHKRGAGGRWDGGGKALLNGAHFLSEVASGHADTITVPRELLRQVLAAADEDAESIENEFGIDYNHRFNLIKELRRAAGMEEER